MWSQWLLRALTPRREPNTTAEASLRALVVAVRADLERGGAPSAEDALPVATTKREGEARLRSLIALD